MSTLLIGVFTLLGVALGLVGERFVRTLGEITCEPREEWGPTFLFENPEGSDWGKESSSQNPFYSDQKPGSATYAFTLDFFNSKELPVGLRSIKIVFECEDGAVYTISENPGTYKTKGNLAKTDPLTTLNLPPRQLVSQQCRGYVRGEDVQTLTGWKTAKFVAEHPGRGWFSGNTYSKIIADR